MTFQEFLQAELTLWKSTHFTVSELLRCDSAAKYSLDNMPTYDEFARLAEFVRILDRVRDLWEGPILIQPDGSGFRDPMVNRKAGGQAFSDHQCWNGAAADIHVLDRSTENCQRLYKLIWQHRASEPGGMIPFDQLILYPNRIHLGWRTGRCRYETLQYWVGPTGDKTWPALLEREIQQFPSKV
jgi:hypothetical protein